MTKAHKMARETASYNGLDPDKVFRARDTHFAKHPVCFIIKETPDGAVVIYGDDPDSTCSTGNHPGRFVAARAAETAGA